MTQSTVERDIHPAVRMMRELRVAQGLSLADVEAKFGVNGIVVGSYERGDRIPPLTKVEQILNKYGHTLVPVPIDDKAVRLPRDMIAELRAIADQLEAAANAV